MWYLWAEKIKHKNKNWPDSLITKADLDLHLIKIKTPKKYFTNLFNKLIAISRIT